MLTVDYGEPDCAGAISALPFLVLNGAEVRLPTCTPIPTRRQVSYYTTTTFDHQK